MPASSPHPAATDVAGATNGAPWGPRAAGLAYKISPILRRSEWEALRQAGCQPQHIFCDTASGTLAARPGLETCLQALGPGDILVVWRLDRLGRSMAHLVALIEGLRQRQVGFRSLGDGAIDTTTASGELIFHLFSALAQFERRLIQERTQAGLATARARGRRGGRRALQRFLTDLSPWVLPEELPTLLGPVFPIFDAREFIPTADGTDEDVTMVLSPQSVVLLRAWLRRRGVDPILCSS